MNLRPARRDMDSAEQTFDGAGLIARFVIHSPLWIAGNG